MSDIKTLIEENRGSVDSQIREKQKARDLQDEKQLRELHIRLRSPEAAKA